MTMRPCTIIFGLLLGFGPVIRAEAAEIKVFVTRAIMTVLEKTGPEFERATGHKLNLTTDIAIRMVRRIQAGEPFDFLVASPGQIDALVKEGKIAAETRTNLVRSGIGVQVRAGAPKPDVSTVEAFKRALLNAKSVGYLREGQSGVYLATLLERLGVADAIASSRHAPISSARESTDTALIGDAAETERSRNAPRNSASRRCRWRMR